MQRPLLQVVLVYALGLMGGHFIAWPILPLFVVGLTISLIYLAGPKSRPFLLGPLLLLLGLINISRCTSLICPYDLRRIAEPTGEYLLVRARLLESPRLRVTEWNQERAVKSSTRIDVEAWSKDGIHWQPALGRVMAHTPGPLPEEFFAGRTAVIQGLLSAPKPPVARTLFDYPRFLRNQSIHFELNTDSVQSWQLASPALPRSKKLSAPWPQRFAAWARDNLARGLPDPDHDEAVRLLWAMSLGWRSALDGEVSQPFMRSGTLHVFAISGLHVTLLSGLLVGGLRLLRLSRGTCGVTAIPLLWFYTAVTGWQASAVRSSVMMTVILAGWALRRPSDLLNSLAAAAFLILIADPLQLFQTGFQLSFAVMLSLALLRPGLEILRKRLTEPDPFLPAELKPRWNRWLDRPTHYITASCLTSLAAWLGSLPLVMHYFHYLTPVSLLSNLAIIPLSGLALTSCVASLLTGVWLPLVSEWFNHSAWLWMNLMIKTSTGMSQWPGAWFYTASPPAAGVILYYLLLAGGMMRAWRIPWARPWFWITTSLLLGMLSWQWHSARDNTRLTILPLEGGDAIYVQTSDSAGNLLIDTGNEAAAKRVTQPFLRSLGVNRLPQLLLTHGDIRHIGGAGQVADAYPKALVLASPSRFRSPSYRDLQHRFEKEARLRILQVGDVWQGWKVLHPASEDEFPLADDRTLVLYREIQGTRLLLCSDLGPKGQDAVLRRFPNLRADVVVSGLPTRSEPLLDGFLEIIRPRLIVITDADLPPTARAGRNLRQRLASRVSELYFTSDCGGVELVLSADGCQALPTKLPNRFEADDNSSEFLKIRIDSSPEQSTGSR